ncbi:hypothetical protein [Funiculus sociatus]
MTFVNATLLLIFPDAIACEHLDSYSQRFPQMTQALAKESLTCLR